MENPGTSLITYMHTLNIYFLCILKKYWMNTKSLKYFFLKRQGSEELSAQCYKDWEKVEQ